MDGDEIAVGIVCRVNPARLTELLKVLEANSLLGLLPNGLE
jgi:hypothetical protein